MKGIIFYTDSRIGEPTKSMVQNCILESGLPIVSVSLKPLEFGRNFVVEGKRSYLTMLEQILVALKNSTSKYVFFCEHDVLYPKSHFDFMPPKDNIFYYNKNVWRWWIYYDHAIKYDKMLPLSCLCTNREFALNHYLLRKQKMEEWGLDRLRSREPRLVRTWGYEPGTKKIRQGGLTNDDFDTWSSEYPVIDLRHKNTLSNPKVDLKDFKHQPTGWQEIKISEIPGWDLKSLFNFYNQ